MRNQRSLTESLLPSSSDSTHGHKQKDVVKQKRLHRSKTAPTVAYIPRDLPSDHSTPTPEPRFRRMHKSVESVTAFLCIYLGIGTICFYLISDQLNGRKTYAIVDALYFSVVTMTTVGYGDLVPRTTLSKLLVCSFVFSGMALIVLVLSKAADYLLNKNETKNVKYKCLVTGIVLVILLLIGTIFLVVVERMDYIDAFYCVCVTVTSLGYRDHSFSTKGGRVFAVLWILTSTICLAHFLLYMAEFNTERRQKALVKWVLNRPMTIYDLVGADLNNDGEVNVAEFVLYKLKMMRKIKQNDVALLLKEFQELDVNHTGTLSILDLQMLNDL